MSFAFATINWLDRHPEFSAEACEVITKVGIEDRPKDEECKKSLTKKTRKNNNDTHGVEMRCSTN